MREQLALLPGYLTAHLQLTLIALLLGLLVSVPAGIWASRRRGAEQAVLGLAGVLQTIPSLALLAVMVPVLALLGGFSESLFGVPVQSIGFLPALIALTVYSLLPMLRNTVTGLAGVDASLVEAARAVGMTPGQRLRRVELPLALPVIVAGVRTATVWVVGTATLSTPVGAPSLGNYIFSGLQTRNFTAVLVGCAAAAALALLLDGLIRLLESGIAGRRRGRLVAAGSLLVALLLYAVASLAAGAGGRKAEVTIGAKTFTEQYILSRLLAGQIERRTGLEIRTLDSLGSTVAFDALRNGEIDAYVDYSGTIWATVMKRETAGAGRERVLAGVARWLEETHGIELAAALGFENAYALAMRSERARELGIGTIADLARAGPELAIGGDYEFFSRAEWRELEEAYGLDFREKRSMDPSLMYEAVANGDVDVIGAFSTDGRIAAYELVVLGDPLQVIPPYDAIVLAGKRLAAEHPEAMAALRELEGRIDATRMRALNLAVDRDGRSPAETAAELLAESG